MTRNKFSRVLIILLGICFLAMLGVSLQHRFTHPGLTANSVASSMPMQKDDETMNAIGSLMREVAENPGNKSGIIHLVEHLISAGQWQTAETFVQKALALDPADSPDPRTLYLLAIIHHNMGRNEQAAELLEKVLEKDENPSARYSLGILYAHFLKKPAEAALQFRKGLDSGKANPALQQAMAEELKKLPAAEQSPAASPEPEERSN